jgi:hypothetical protein
MMRHNLCNQLGRLREQPAFRVAGAEKLVRLAWMRTMSTKLKWMLKLMRGRAADRWTGCSFARSADNNKWPVARRWFQDLSDVIARRFEVA